MNIKNEKGIALIMSIGIVAMLAIIGTTFAINMRLEQKASANYLAGIKAKTLAEAGIDHAIAVLRLYAITQAYSDIDDEWRWYGAAIKVYGTSDYSGAYEVSAVDCASRIYINDGLYLTGTSESDRKIRLATMLNNLCVAIGSPLDGDEGTAIVNNRPTGTEGGYLTKESVRQVINDTAEYNAIKNYITVNAWVDPDTIRPLGSAATPEVQARTPVNVNTASKPVLRAVLQGAGKDVPSTISSTDASNVADDIISQRRIHPFTNWNSALLIGGFNQYINGLSAITTAQQDVVKANANPNTQLNRLNPNSTWKAPVDKTELTTGNTTEFCFNSMGYYELESTGTVTIGSATVAQKKVKALVRLYDLWRQTTQAQFEAGNKGTPAYVSTYPEFDPDESTVSASTLDGQIMIKKNAMDSPAGVIFRASFTGNGTQDADDFDAQTGVGGTNSTVSGLTEASIFSAGDLYSDGAKIDAADTLYYLAASNITNPGTIEMWVKPYYTSGTHYFFKWEVDANKYLSLWHDVAINTVSARLRDDVNGADNTDTEALSSTSGQWYHIAVTWYGDSSTNEVQVFVDGTSASKTAQAGPSQGFGISGGSIYVGSNGALGNQAQATIGEVRIWNTQRWSGTGSPLFTSDDLYQDSTDGTFESSSSPSIGTGRRLGTISWTESIPSGISGDIQFGIDPAGGSSFSGTYGADGGSETSIGKAGGSSVLNINTTGASIKYKTTLSASGAPLKDTPVLDDVTITYFTPVRFFSWQEVAE